MDSSKKKLSFTDVRVLGDLTTIEEHSKEKQGSVQVISRLESPPKPKWQVFMFGFGTGKFPTKMELNDIKNRQLRRQQTANTMSDGGGGQDQSDTARSGKKQWWSLIDVFRCGGGYEGDAAVKDLQVSFPTLRKFQ